MLSASAVQAKFAPNAKENYVRALQLGEEQLAEHGITTPIRLAHFMAQVMHETGGLRLTVESGLYSKSALGKLWDAGNWHRYFENRAACLSMADRCRQDRGEALFNLVYGNRMGNGPPSSGDGWKYRGRGLLQTTGRWSYNRFGERCKVDFEDDPDLVLEPEHALKPALSEWKDHNLNAAADANEIKVITKKINGGYNGLADRKAWFARIWPFVTGSVPVEETIEWKVQEALTAAGFDTNGIDGVIGPDTRTAILDFRNSRNLAGPPRITRDLLLALGLTTA